MNRCNHCGSLNCNNGCNPTNVYFTNVTGNLTIPFTTDTTVLTLPVKATICSLQPVVKIDGDIQLQADISAPTTLTFQYAISIQLRRSGTSLITETFRQAGTLSAATSITQTDVVPISFVDNAASLGMNTYTVVANFFENTGGATITVTAQTRTLNAITF